jgi:uncharacterized membrane protein YsdA (DUF1294 family)/cold shock CspA family protein
MRQAGRISQWNDAKGFGFVTPHAGGSRAFVHIKAFQASGRRPAAGDLISYDAAPDAKGRLTATQVRFAGQRIAKATSASPRRAVKPTPPKRVPRMAMGIGFLLVAVGLMVAGLVPALLPLGYLLMSSVSYLLYGYDKQVAGKTRWQRIPESDLHLLDLLGGWPGGLVAQQALRHKSVKASFQRGFRVTVVLNLALYAAWWRSGLAAAWTEWVLG